MFHPFFFSFSVICFNEILTGNLCTLLPGFYSSTYSLCRCVLRFDFDKIYLECADSILFTLSNKCTLYTVYTINDKNARLAYTILVLTSMMSIYYLLYFLWFKCFSQLCCMSMTYVYTVLADWS